MKRLFGNTAKLKADQIRRLGNLYRRRLPVQFLITSELALEIGRLSQELRRQIGLLINRQGKVVYVIIGDHQGLMLPDTSDYRVAPDRLRGLRCIHTHLNAESLTRDDLTDLAFLRLDLIAAIVIDDEGQPLEIHAGHILPRASDGLPYEILPPIKPNRLDIGCLDLIQALENELAQIRSAADTDPGKELALLISVTTASRAMAEDSLAELKELAISSGMQVVGTIRQHRKTKNPRFLMGLGKLKDLAIIALQKGATVIVFDQELNPSQIRSITDRIELKVIDRTQLILDIFAQRAQSREGKLQVELAQLKYLLPRLITKNTAMSRLTGGIGGRGPGETRLEINRRRVRDTIVRLEKQTSNVGKQRKQQRARRQKRGLPIISIIGYTNAGKSTLLNTLTKSNVRAESRLFATLDPASKRLRFPRDVEVIITDTVGFIKDLPKDLLVAFRATLEALESADLLLHVIDISNPRFEDQIESVERILRELNLNHIPIIRILNKQDRMDPSVLGPLRQRLDGTAVSANDRSTLPPLIGMLEDSILKIRPSMV
ncbi:MAG: GTPase HflX [Desulfobacterales bacterium]